MDLHLQSNASINDEDKKTSSPEKSSANDKQTEQSYLGFMSNMISSSMTTSFAISSAVVGTVYSGVEQAASALQPDPIICLRPSWNTQFGLAIKTLRITAHTVQHDTSTIRLLTDHGIPSFILPGGVSYHKSRVPRGEWTYLTSTNFKTTKDLNLPVPIILYFHGGAFCCCGSKTHRGLLFRLVRATGAIVFAVDYRRPPEHPFPTPIMDCIEAYQYLLSNFVDPARIVFAGDSAGGSLVASVSMKVHEMGLPRPAGGLMLSPWVDLSDAGITDSWYRNESYDYLPQALAKYFASQYMGSLTNDALASPLYSQHLCALPRLHVEVGECEVLHDQILSFCEKVKASGVEVDIRVRADMVHVFCLFSFTGLKQCKDAFVSMGEFVRSCTAGALLESNSIVLSNEDIDLDGDIDENAADVNPDESVLLENS